MREEESVNPEEQDDEDSIFECEEVVPEESESLWIDDKPVWAS